MKQQSDLDFFETRAHSAKSTVAALPSRAQAKTYAYLDLLRKTPRADVRLKKTNYEELWEKKFDLPEGGLRVLFAFGLTGEFGASAPSSSEMIRRGTGSSRFRMKNLQSKPLVDKEDTMNELERAIDEFRREPENEALFLESQAEIALCERMVAMRLDAGLTQVELAKRLGKTQAYVAKMESGGYDRCGIGTLRTFARAMGADLAVSKMFVDSAVDRVGAAFLAARPARKADHFAKVVILASYFPDEPVAAAG